MIKYNVNMCDNIFNSLDVHFTKACENKCSFCIDRNNVCLDAGRPNVSKIINTIEKYKDKIWGINISGGEPCLYMEELLQLVLYLKKKTTLFVRVISSMPTVCFEKKEILFQIISLVDSFEISPQHHIEEIADKIRGVESKYNHQDLYRMLPDKQKIGININLLKPYLCTREDICECIRHYNSLGFENIKIAELKGNEDIYVSFEEVFGIKMKSPFGHGCKTKDFDITPWIPEFKGHLTIKRTCFLTNSCLHANFADTFKIATRKLFEKKYFFGIIYGTGEIHPYWIS